MYGERVAVRVTEVARHVHRTVGHSPATVSASIVPSGTGSWLAGTTVTSNVWVAESPPGSVAVTVTVALPAATPATVTSAPETLTVANASSEEAALYVSSSPSGSLKLPDTSTAVAELAGSHLLVRDRHPPGAGPGWPPPRRTSE